MKKNQVHLDSKHNLVWKQKDVYVFVQSYFLPNDSNTFQMLINDLLSRKQIFTLYLSKAGNQLLLYLFGDKSELFDDEKISEVISEYNCKKIDTKGDLFFSKILDVKHRENVISVKTEHAEYYISSYLLKTKSKQSNLKKSLTTLVKIIQEQTLFDIVLYQSYSLSNDTKSPKWALMLITKSRKLDEILKREITLKRILPKTRKFNVIFNKITKREINWNVANFQFLVPWIKNDGIIVDFIDLLQIVDIPKIQNTINRTIVSIPQLHSESPKQKLKKHPLPSVREIMANSFKETDNRPIKHEIAKPESLMPNLLSNNKSHLITNIPLPRKTPIVNVENLKLHLNILFRTIGYKESFIFNNKFELVMRKDSSYLLFKILDKPLVSSTVIEIIDEIAQITNLRHNVQCIIIAPSIEKLAKKIINETSIIFISTREVLNNKIKEKLQASLAQVYPSLSLV